MNRVFPSAEYLNQEEVDFELTIRRQPEDVFALDLVAKQRHLRKLFKDDLKEGRSYRSPYTISCDAEHIIGRIDTLEKALEKKVEARYESRVLHYWYRAKWSKAQGDEEKNIRKDLCRRIESIMKHYQFGPPQSPIISQINNILSGNDQEGAVGGQDTGAQESGNLQTNGKEPVPELSSTSEDEEIPRVLETGAIPKQPKPNKSQPKFEVTREEWESMRRLITQLTLNVAKVDFVQNSTKEKAGNNPNPNPFVFPTPLNKLQPTAYLNAQIPNQQRLEHTKALPVGPKPTNRQSERIKPLNNHRYTEYDISSDEEPDRRWRKEPCDLRDRIPQPRPQGHHRGGRPRATEISEVDESSGPVYENTRHRFNYPPSRQGFRFRHGHQNRIEKWKLRFSGDQRAMSVETFLYKAKKLAEREDVPREILLRDIHMLLEGSASDWFFTFVDELQTWDQFETSITYRFGNPNMDQGIRSKIQERKQLRGEPFIAFVSEIEKFDRLLSRPLSKRRKFEVIWDNMRQHYRTKISLFEVNDLNHLIRLNHRIDAADPQLQQQPGEMTNRRPVNQVSAESDNESDQSASINAIGNRGFRNSRDGNQQPNRREQQNTSDNPSQANTLSCWNCQERGHSWRQCQQPKVVFCYGCGNLGRVIRNCERCSRRTDGANQNQGNE